MITFDFNVKTNLFVQISICPFTKKNENLKELLSKQFAICELYNVRMVDFICVCSVFS